MSEKVRQRLTKVPDVAAAPDELGGYVIWICANLEDDLLAQGAIADVDYTWRDLMNWAIPFAHDLVRTGQLKILLPVLEVGDEGEP